MIRIRSEKVFGIPAALLLNWNLPPGVRQSDCEGVPIPLAEANAGQLWSACSPAQQDAMAGRFSQTHADTLRDAILDLEDHCAAARASPGAVQRMALAELLWSSWVRFRDGALRELRRRGEITSS